MEIYENGSNRSILIGLLFYKYFGITLLTARIIGLFELRPCTVSVGESPVSERHCSVAHHSSL